MTHFVGLDVSVKETSVCEHIRRRPSVGSPLWNPEPEAPVVIPWAGQFGHRPARRVAFEPGSRPALDRAHAVALWT
jgi:hypothetical protein